MIAGLSMDSSIHIVFLPLCMRWLALLSLIWWLPLSSRGQGNLYFDNVIVAPGPAPVTRLYDGAYVGSNYTASLFFVNGTVTDEALFESMNPIWFAPADTRFFGTTGTGAGHGLDGDGSGFFVHGIVDVGVASGQQITVQVRAWYNGDGLYTSYFQAAAAGQDVGQSNLIPITLATGLGNPLPLDGLMPFTVGIPEPSTFAMLGLSGLVISFWLLLHRRR